MKILVVVDMQNDFIDGALGTEEAKTIVPKVVEKINSFDGIVAVTRDTHQENYLDTQEGKNLPVTHCIENSCGWLLPDTVCEALFDKDIEVFTKSTFGSVSLANWITNIDIICPVTDVVFIGLCTDICVISNALLIKAFLPEAKITVDAACCAGVTPESHANALAAMKMCQINIENWEE
jgi:nicotinamidase-related amidase